MVELRGHILQTEIEKNINKYDFIKFQNIWVNL